MSDESPWVALLVGLACLVPFTVQALIFGRNRRRHRRWARAEATVTGTTTSQSENGARSHTSTYRYTDRSGVPRSGRGTVGSDEPPGAGLQILYDPDQPARSMPTRPVGMGHYVAGTLGGLLFLAGLIGIATALTSLTSLNG